MRKTINLVTIIVIVTLFIANIYLSKLYALPEEPQYKWDYMGIKHYETFSEKQYQCNYWGHYLPCWTLWDWDTIRI